MTLYNSNLHYSNLSFTGTIFPFPLERSSYGQATVFQSIIIMDVFTLFWLEWKLMIFLQFLERDLCCYIVWKLNISICLLEYNFFAVCCQYFLTAYNLWDFWYYSLETKMFREFFSEIVSTFFVCRKKQSTQERSTQFIKVLKVIWWKVFCTNFFLLFVFHY